MSFLFPERIFNHLKVQCICALVKIQCLYKTGSTDQIHTMNESSSDVTLPAQVILRDHISALTLMKFLLLVATVFCEDKMDCLTPESAQHDVQFSGHTKPWYCQ